MGKTFSAAVLRPKIAEVLLRYGIDNLQLEIDLSAALRPLFDDETRQKETERGDVFDYLKAVAKNNPEVARQLEMRNRAEAALKKNVNDWERGEWANFDKFLAKRPEHETIERFVDWWMSDDFRAKQGTVYLNARKIKENWLQVFDAKREPVKADNDGGFR